MTMALEDLHETTIDGQASGLSSREKAALASKLIAGAKQVIFLAEAVGVLISIEEI
jgi:hypothetical protein